MPVTTLTPQQINDAHYDLYGTELIMDDGFRQFSADELLNTLEDWTVKEIKQYLEG